MGNDGSTPTKSESGDEQRSTERAGGSTSKSDSPRKRTKKKKSNRTKKGTTRAPNPFLIFFMRMRSKNPNEHVTTIARTAGKLWGKMTPDQRQKYVKLAKAAKKKKVKIQKKESEEIDK